MGRDRRRAHHPVFDLELFILFLITVFISVEDRWSFRSARSITWNLLLSSGLILSYMKKFIIIAFVTASIPAWAGEKPITLKQCLASAIEHKASLQGARSEAILAEFETNEAMGKYLPQLTLNYEYNTIRSLHAGYPHRAAPANPTDEYRAIKFGMTWQQNAGLTLYQPMLDFTIQSKLNEAGSTSR